MVRTYRHSSALTTSFTNSSACALCLVKHAAQACFRQPFILPILPKYMRSTTSLRTKITSDVTAIKVHHQQSLQLMPNCAGRRSAATCSQAWRCYWTAFGTALQVSQSSSVHSNTVALTTVAHSGIKQRPQQHCVLLNVHM